MSTETHTVIDELLSTPPYDMGFEEKAALYSRALSDLTLHHYAHCSEYKLILNLLGYIPGSDLLVEEIPFLPVRLFKDFDLLSVERRDVVRLITSSGTSGQQASRIYLDRTTSLNQTRVLSKIASSILGAKRLPLLMVDSPSVIADRASFSARGAGILGFSMLGYDMTYLLDDHYQIDYQRLDAFLERHSDKTILLFGFTFMIWKYLCQALQQAGRRLQIGGVLIHGGGWKKMTEHAVDNETFTRTLKATCGILDVRNYYGMVEQAGSIFVECERSLLHASVFSDVFVRDPVSFSPMDFGRPGLLQLLSLVPMSYPGHSLLTEDLGEILGVDDCPCGRKGKYFRVLGRVKDAELRGCSDVHASN